ncbi:MAG: MBL fold metallo-hydrolase [Chloroflexota bacterium]|jgi:glyoxylase-like metal-dependent hydrolase (beta-lactamase superfamily II)
MTFTFHRIPVGICNCYLLRGERTILIDGGAQGGINAFVRGMERLRLDPKEISLMLLTHGHWDHIGALHPIQQLTGAKVAVHHRDQPWVESGAPPFPPGVNAYGRAMSALAKTLLHPKLPSVKADLVLGDGGISLAEYGIPGKVVYTPGHTMGHVSILLDTGDAFVGDMAMNDWYLRLTPGLPILAEDIGMVVESWKKILPMGIKRIYPAHGMDFPVEVMHREIADFDRLHPRR